MGRKKTKRFIDKKKATTYSLVHRSQNDPLANDAGQPQMVLQASAEAVVTADERKEEQKKFGIYFDDDYDYLQHLQEPGLAVSSEMFLPSELFGTEVKATEKLGRVLPTSGPRPDWDSEIIAALEKAEEEEEEEDGDRGELEDDFVMLANGGEPGVAVYINEKPNNTESLSDPWWTERGEFLQPQHSNSLPATTSLCVDSEDEAEEKEEKEGSLFSGCERRTAQFTEYSISSSVVPRNKGLTLLDERFEELMCEYNNDQLGAPEEEEEEEEETKKGVQETSTEVADAEELLLGAAMAEYEKHHHEKIVSWSKVADTLGKSSSERERFLEEEEEEEEETSGSEIDEVVKRPKDRWDCESILSTYSNIYNHPKLITEPTPMKQKIRLSQTTGFPQVEVLRPNSDTTMPVTTGHIVSSRKNETRDEKQQRKKAIKEERRERRAEKKATKMAFRSQQLRQERTILNRQITSPVA